MVRPIKVTKPQLLHTNPYSKILHYHADFSDFSKDYYVTYFGPRVGIVLVKDSKVLLIKQYRFLINSVSLEIPGGAIEANETPLKAIKRELYEETGINCNIMTTLATYYPGLDNVENRTTIFLSEDFDLAKNFVPNEQEAFDYIWMPIDQCVEEIITGKQLDALTIIGVMTYYGTRNRK